MSDNKKNDMKKHLIKEGYEVKGFSRKSGDWYYFKVQTFRSGTHTVKVKDGLFDFKIEKA
ncbi:hypothetical protein M3215_06190 [Bacillus cytotoxicus]|uniref:Uncharacterized protein n=1 Tax=Bacillus cytotoxicus TaxID=580165 RepID=A0ACC6A3E7_9BACI|nr:hypothetical protein [Bacillus cytotoxicus]